MTDSVTIENLTIDDVNYIVADLPEEVQGAVQKYEDWRDRFAVAQDEVALVGAALRDLGAQIVAAIRQTEAAASEEEVLEDDLRTDEEPVASRADTLVVEDEAE